MKTAWVGWAAAGLMVISGWGVLYHAAHGDPLGALAALGQAGFFGVLLVLAWEDE